MALNQLDKWKELYWKAELSDEEEGEFKKELAAKKDQLSGELLDLAEWFEAQSSTTEGLKLDSSFDEELMSKIQHRSQASDSWNWLKIAASILIISGLAYFSIWFPTSDERVGLADDKVENPEMAYQDAKATLKLMASIMNDSKEHLNSLEMINVAQEKVKDTFQPKSKSKKDS